MTGRACVLAAAGLLAGCSPDADNGPRVVAGDAGPSAAGFTVTTIAVPAGPGSAQARLGPHTDGRVLLSWLEPAGDREYALRFAALAASGDWGPVQTVASGREFFVNWADFPSVLPIAGDFWVAHWLQRQPESFGAYDAVVAVSSDAGATWSPGEKLNDDATQTEHGFVELFAIGDEARALWLDGRELANWSFDAPDALLGVSLRVAAVEADGSVADREIVDPLVCDCCQPDVAIAQGVPLIAYRDRTEDEIRDIVVRQWRGSGWAPAQDVSGERWRIEGCPVNGPAIAAADAHVALAWFTAADSESRVRFARSDDAGRSFSEPLDLDAEGSYGQVDVVIDRDGTAVVSWWRRGEGGGIDLAVRAVPALGAPGPIHVVAHEAVSQPVDVPQLVAAGDRFLLSWTSIEGEGSIRAVAITLP